MHILYATPFQCCIYYADLSPQDSTLLPDVIEVGRLPCLTLEDEATRYCFYILTRHGLRYECSSKSKIQVCQICLIFYTLPIRKVLSDQRILKAVLVLSICS